MKKPQVKINEKNLKEKKRFLLYFLMDSTIFVWMASRIHIRDSYFFFALALLVFAITVQIILDWSAWGFSNNCPSCNTKFDKPMNWPLKEGDKIQFYCQKCNIIWDEKETYSTG